MSISGDYPAPVSVNGFQCHNCAEVDEAKKFIDPAHPASGPFGVDAKTDPTRAFDAAVKLGGAFANAKPGARSTNQSSAQTPGGDSRSRTPAQVSGFGGQLDISV